MQSKPVTNLYEYAVIRYVPRVEREEFINVGLVMMCKKLRWVKARILLDRERVLAFSREVDLAAVESQLQSFLRIAEGCAGPIGTLEAHERFRWLTAVRSACIQTSRPHPGHSSDLPSTFDRLFDELVE